MTEDEDTNAESALDLTHVMSRLNKYTASERNRLNIVDERVPRIEVVSNGLVTKREYYESGSDGLISAVRFTGAVYDGSLNLIVSSLRFNQNDIVPVDDPVLPETRRTDAVAISGDVLYLGILFPILGHFLFETLARLWPLVDGSVVPANVKILAHPWPGLNEKDFKSNPLYRFILNSIGIDIDNIIVIDRDLRIERMIFPDALSVYHQYLDRQMLGTFDQISAYVPGRIKVSGDQPGNVLFLSRSLWSENRRIENEIILDEILGRLGAEIIHTQLMSPEEIIHALRSSDIVVSTDGSHAHLMIFCENQTKALMLDTRVVPTQYAIEELRHFNAIHVPLSELGLFSEEGRALIRLEALESLLQKCLDELKKGISTIALNGQ